MPKKIFNGVFFEYFLIMSDNHHIDVNIVKKADESPFKLEISATRLSLNADMGKLEAISFSDEVLTFQFNKGHLRIELAIDDINNYLSLKETIKEL
ncbi:MAG: hypothetical protein ACXACR_10370 [Candidatus Hodarchaeales archaeon]